MKFHWSRILNAGLVAEIVFYAILATMSQLDINRPQIMFFLVTVGGFLFMFVAAFWVSRKIESRFILHGFLVSLVAIVCYLILSFPDVIAGEYPFSFLLANLIGNPPKILGGVLGGYLGSKIKK